MNPDEIHDMVMFLKEELAAGRIKINSQHTIDALQQVRLGPSGKVDPSTVDGSVRAMGLAILAAKEHRELREIPLQDVQARYFDILEQNFGTIYKKVKESGVSVQSAAKQICKDEAWVTAFTNGFPKFAAGLTEFWEFFGPVVVAHLSDWQSLKSVFGGDIFPSYTSNIACSVGLYMDTVVLPDPLCRIITLAGHADPKEVARLAIKHSLNAMGYRELALADLNPPVVVIAPDQFGLDAGYSNAISIGGNVDAVLHMCRLFGRDFEHPTDVIEFVDKLGTSEQVVAAMTNPNLILFDSDWSQPVSVQLDEYLKTVVKPNGVGASYGDAVYFSAVGRMMMSNDALLRSASCGGSPLIDAPISWEYLRWKYEYDAMAGRESDNLSHVLISKALGSTMLDGIPPETLIELRKNGAASELREIISKGIGDINSASDADVSLVADAVIANVDSAFQDHDSKLKNLSHSQRKFYGWDIGRYIATGGLGIASALTQNATLAALAAVAQIAGNPAPEEIKKRYMDLRSRSTSLRRSPVGMMFNDLKNKFGFH